MSFFAKVAGFFGQTPKEQTYTPSNDADVTIPTTVYAPPQPVTPTSEPPYEKILNVFETGAPETNYHSVYIYNDGTNGRKQITLGRGFTEDGGSLGLVIQLYILNGGAMKDYFQRIMPNVGHGILHFDTSFINALKTASDEEVMRNAQDEIYRRVYLQPGKDWAQSHGFDLPLSIATVLDSYLHSGSMKASLMAQFPEKKPSDGGNEKIWIESYLNTRLQWLGSFTNEVRNTIYRPLFFLGEIKRNNWTLQCPLSANGTNIC